MSSVSPVQELSHIETMITPLMPASGAWGGRRDGLGSQNGGCQGKASAETTSLKMLPAKEIFWNGTTGKCRGV